MDESGAAGGTRTPDPIITNDVLYQLSYCGDPSTRRADSPVPADPASGKGRSRAQFTLVGVLTVDSIGGGALSP